MKILISPSKTMNYSYLTPENSLEDVRFKEISEDLSTRLKGMDHDSLKKLYKASDKVVSEAMGANMEGNRYKSIELFNGLVFKYLDYKSMDTVQRRYLDDNLLIFSAMYGIIKANDAISPYRLDLKDSLKPHIYNLKKLWHEHVIRYINCLDTDVVVDLASTEYRSLVDPKKVEKTYIRIDFKDMKGGKYRSMATFSKMARGLFVRQMALEGVLTVEEIKNILVMDYSYDKKMSSDIQFVFSR